MNRGRQQATSNGPFSFSHCAFVAWQLLLSAFSFQLLAFSFALLLAGCGLHSPGTAPDGTGPGCSEPVSPAATQPSDCKT